MPSQTVTQHNTLPLETHRLDSENGLTQAAAAAVPMLAEHASLLRHEQGSMHVLQCISARAPLQYTCNFKHMRQQGCGNAQRDCWACMLVFLHLLVTLSAVKQPLYPLQRSASCARETELTVPFAGRACRELSSCSKVAAVLLATGEAVRRFSRVMFSWTLQLTPLMATCCGASA